MDCDFRSNSRVGHLFAKVAVLFLWILAGGASPSSVWGRDAKASPARAAGGSPDGSGPIGMAQLQQRLRRAYAHPLAKVGTLGVYVKVRGGPVIFSRRGAQALHPASCVKLVTSAAALRELGASFRFVTQLRGAVEGGTMTTPLFLVGQGDPTLTRDDLQRFAAVIKGKGITEIPSLVVDDTFFDRRRWPPGFRHPSSSAYTTPTGAVSLDGNTVEVVVTPTSEGERAQVTLVPPSDYLELTSAVTTGPKTMITVVAIRSGSKLKVQVTGRVQADGGPERRWTRVLDPARYAGESFRRLLEAQGIKVGPVQVGQRGSGPELHRHSSAPLTELVTHMNRTSNNHYAEQILKALGAQKVGEPGSTEKGITVARGLLQRSGMRQGTYRMQNGSGLLGNNAFSARQMVQLMERIHTLPWLYDAIRDSLPVAGLAGTLSKRLGGTAAAGRLRAKTGTLNGVSCLAGFVDGPKGRPPIIFAILHSGFTGSQARSRKVQDMMVEAMARYMLSR